MSKRAMCVVIVVAVVGMGTTLPYYSVKRGLDAAAATLDACAGRYANAKAHVTLADNTLGAVATTYADLIETVNGYGTTNAAEAHAKAELAKLQAEFNTLKAKTDAMKDAFQAVEDHGAAAVKAKLAELDE